eukprot:5338509-Amphidinium_carterae.1
MRLELCNKIATNIKRIVNVVKVRGVGTLDSRRSSLSTAFALCLIWLRVCQGGRLTYFVLRPGSFR